MAVDIFKNCKNVKTRVRLIKRKGRHISVACTSRSKVILAAVVKIINLRKVIYSVKAIMSVAVQIFVYFCRHLIQHMLEKFFILSVLEPLQWQL